MKPLLTSPNSPRVGYKTTRPRNSLFFVLLVLVPSLLLYASWKGRDTVDELSFELPVGPPSPPLPETHFGREDEGDDDDETSLPSIRDSLAYRPFIAPGVEPASPATLSSGAYSLSQFLSERLETGATQRPDKLWLTVADEKYSRNALDHLTRMLGRLNAQQRAASPGSTQPHTLLVLCLDQGCATVCEEKGWLCYSGYVNDEYPPGGPNGMGKVQWMKSRGMADLLSAGYATLFVDADVFFRKDPFESMLKPLSDPSWDIQIQDESHDGMVNIGFIFMRASEKAASIWVDIQDRLQKQGGWDQDHFNAILDTVALRKHHERSFVASDGLKVEVLHPTDAWGFHFGWMFPEETSLLHMTCCGTELEDKLYIAGAYGALRDAASYVQDQRDILTVSTLSGNSSELALTMRVLMAAARASGRAFLPPLMGTVLGKPDAEDGLVRGNLQTISVDSRGDRPDPERDPLTLHRRFFWSIFKPSVLMHHYPDVALLEPNYFEHALPALIDDGQIDTAKSLSHVVELDLRPIFEWQMLVDRLKSPLFRSARIVRISTDEGTLIFPTGRATSERREGPTGFWSRFAKWELPETAPRISPCYQIEKVPLCSQFCRIPPNGWLEEV